MHKELADLDALLLDVDGLLFDTGKEIPGASDALRLFVQLGIELMFVTNNVIHHKAKTCQRIQLLLPDSDVQLVDPLDVLEAMALRETPSLRERCFIVGSEVLASRLADLGCNLIGPDSTKNASLVLISSTTEVDYKALRAATRMVLNGAVLYSTGRERLFSWRGELWPSTGALLAAVETASGRKGIVLGKPSPEIFHLAAKRLTKRERILVVGDDVDADVCGAQNAGYKSALVLTGISKYVGIGKRVCKPTFVFGNLLELAEVLSRSQ